MSCMENCVWTIPSLLSSRSKGGSDPTCRPGWQCTHSVILNQYSSFNVMIPLLLFSLSLFWQPDRNQDCLNSQILFGFSYFRLCRKLLVKKKNKSLLGSGNSSAAIRRQSVTLHSASHLLPKRRAPHSGPGGTHCTATHSSNLCAADAPPTAL